MSETNLYSYLITHDSEFTLNPFHRNLTIAIFMTDIHCKKSMAVKATEMPYLDRLITCIDMLKMMEFWMQLVFEMLSIMSQYILEKSLCKRVFSSF
jgi:hypothetical protein